MVYFTLTSYQWFLIFSGVCVTSSDSNLAQYDSDVHIPNTWFLSFTLSIRFCPYEMLVSGVVLAPVHFWGKHFCYLVFLRAVLLPLGMPLSTINENTTQLKNPHLPWMASLRLLQSYYALLFQHSAKSTVGSMSPSAVSSWLPARPTCHFEAS